MNKRDFCFRRAILIKSKRVCISCDKHLSEIKAAIYEFNLSRMEAIEDRKHFFVHLILFPDVCNGSFSIQTLSLGVFSEYSKENCGLEVLFCWFFFLSGTGGGL